MNRGRILPACINLHWFALVQRLELAFQMVNRLLGLGLDLLASLFHDLMGVQDRPVIEWQPGELREVNVGLCEQLGQGCINGRRK